jgi:hypothetical protein
MTELVGVHEEASTAKVGLLGAGLASAKRVAPGCCAAVRSIRSGAPSGVDATTITRL